MKPSRDQASRLLMKARTKSRCWYTPRRLWSTRRRPAGSASTFSGSAAVAIWLVTPITRAGSVIGKRIT